jgi:hypothetical protein
MKAQPKTEEMRQTLEAMHVGQNEPAESESMKETLQKQAPKAKLNQKISCLTPFSRTLSTHLPSTATE